MSIKICLLTLCLLSFACSRANAENKIQVVDKKEVLIGFVTHTETKRPVKDVTVTAYFESKKEKIVITGDEGDYSFDFLKPGTYKIVFEKAGFKKIVKEKIIIKTDEAFQINIEMVEIEAYDLMPSPFHFAAFK
jgi:hypothetical protein